MKDLIHKVDASFRASLKGQENISVLIRWWGFLGYAFFYFVIDSAILKINIAFIDLVLSWIGVIYFLWHIFVMIKCSPKKPKLTPEEKKKLREEKLRNAPRAFMRKLLLQESITKWNPVAMTIAADILFFANFLGYVLH